MKREADTIHYLFTWDQFGPVPKNAIAAAKSVLAQIGKGFSTMIVAMQVSRMNSVLHSMSDGELEAIGIDRREIGAHAKALIIPEDKQNKDL